MTKWKTLVTNRNTTLLIVRSFFLFVWYATERPHKDRTDEVMCNIKQGLVLLKKYYLLLSDVINSIRTPQCKHSLCKIEWYNPYPNFHPCTCQTLLRLPVWHKKKGLVQRQASRSNKINHVLSTIVYNYTVRVLDLLTHILRSCEAELPLNKIIQHVKKVRYNKSQCTN